MKQRYELRVKWIATSCELPCTRGQLRGFLARLFTERAGAVSANVRRSVSKRGSLAEGGRLFLLPSEAGSMWRPRTQSPASPLFFYTDSPPVRSPVGLFTRESHSRRRQAFFQDLLHMFEPPSRFCLTFCHIHVAVISMFSSSSALILLYCSLPVHVKNGLFYLFALFLRFLFATFPFQWCTYSNLHKFQ